MIELMKPGSVPGTESGTAPLTTERLEAEICTLAGHLAAATCRFIDLIADYDERKAWAQWEMRSCAQWLSWKCSLAPGTAREYVRVGRALRTLPVIHREFAAGRMSYSKVRELTRIAGPGTEAELADMATPMTAAQVERFARAYGQCSQEQPEGQAVPQRSLKWRFDQETGEMSLTVRLPAAEGAVVLQALRAATGDLDHPHDGPGSKDQDLTGDDWPQAFKVAAGDLADALVEVSGNYLQGKVNSADNADIYQVIVHVTPDILGVGVPGGTPATHPCRPGRCHLEDGPAITAEAASLIACDATVSAMTHGLDTEGTILNVGRRSRKVTAAIRRAVRERDGTRCGFPGCESRRVDLHHIRWWSNGGETSLDNLMNLCRTHHRLVHRKAYIISRGPGGTYTFTDPGTGTAIGPARNLPGGDSDISGAHHADISAATIQQARGEHLDLHYAIWLALHNGRNPRTTTPGHRLYNIPQPDQGQPDQGQPAAA